MERDLLEAMLAEGLSLAAIGRRVGRHESTVAYWLERYGLRAVAAGKHAARGGLTREQLAPLVAEGLSTSQIALRLERSKTTVRHWLKEYGLVTLWSARRGASRSEVQTLELECPHHGPTLFKRRGDGGFRCIRCRSEAVTKRRREVKRILVAEAGGSCVACGYDRCIGALEFHHLDPAEKLFSLSHRVARSLARTCASRGR